MNKGDTLSLGEFRKQTADMPDNTPILIAAEGCQYYSHALVVAFYPYENTLSNQGVLLLRPDPTESVTFQDC